MTEGLWVLVGFIAGCSTTLAGAWFLTRFAYWLWDKLEIENGEEGTSGELDATIGKTDSQT